MAVNQVKEDILEKEFKTFKNKNLSLPKLKNLYLFTVNHNTAPVAIREKFSIPEYRLVESKQALKSCKSIKSFVILSTCNRTEIYFTCDALDKAQEEILTFFSKHLGLEEKVVKEYHSLLSSDAVVKHLFRLGCGLESLVLGEKQILSQIKFAYSTAQSEKTLDKTLELLFQTVLKTAKEVHEKTNISKNSQSISSAAIDLADKVAGPVKTKSVMVLGAGNMAKLALEHILKIGGSGETVVLNKSPHRVIEFSKEYKVDRSFPFEDIYKVLNDVDVVVCAAGAPHFIIFAQQFKEFRKDQNKSLFIFDLSMPRNIDSEFGKLPNVKLYDIDSLQNVYSKTIQSNNHDDLHKVKEIILEGEKDFYTQISSQDLDLLIKDLKEKFENIRKGKLEKLSKEKTSFTKEEVDYVVKNLIDTIFHGPLKILKKSAKKEYVEVIRDLFGL